MTFLLLGWRRQNIGHLIAASDGFWLPSRPKKVSCNDGMTSMPSTGIKKMLPKAVLAAARQRVIAYSCHNLDSD